MTCDVVQRHLLGCEGPDGASAAAAAHLAACAACREWLLRLVQIERAVPHLPVPPAEAARSALVRRILARETRGGPKAEAPRRPRDRRRPSVALVLGSWIMDPYASPRRRVGAGLVAGMAAALLLFFTGWLVWHSDSSPQVVHGTAKLQPDNSLAGELRRHQVTLAEATAPRDRIRALAEAADQLHARSRDGMVRGRDGARKASADELKDLAGLYKRVVQEGIMKSAEELSAEERRSVLKPIADALGDAESQWLQLSQQTGLPNDVQKALKECAVAASEGNKGLKKLYEA